MHAGSTHVLVNTLWGCRQAVVAVNIATGEVTRMTPTDRSCGVVAATEEHLFVHASSLDTPPHVLHTTKASLMAALTGGTVAWTIQVCGVAPAAALEAINGTALHLRQRPLDDRSSASGVASASLGLPTDACEACSCRVSP